MSTKIRHFNNKKRHKKTPLPFRKVKAPGLERILFMRTKHNMQIFNYQSYKTTLEQQLNSENWGVKLGHLSAFGWAMLFSCPVLGRIRVYMFLSQFEIQISITTANKFSFPITVSSHVKLKDSLSFRTRPHQAESCSKITNMLHIRSKHIKGSKWCCFLRQNTTCKFWG